MDQLLTPREVSALLQISTRTLRRLSIPRIRFGRSVRYSQREVTRWLEARQIGG